MRQIPAIGYRNIELAGLAGLTAVQLRALADQNRLNIVGAHMNILDFRNNRAIKGDRHVPRSW